MTAIAVMYGGMPDAIVAQVKHMPPLVELHGEADRNVPLASGGELVNLAIGELGVPVLFTEAARFQSWLDVEAALAELTIITAEMPDSSIHGMRIGLHFRRSLISAPGYTGSRGTCEVRPRGKLCCHRLGSKRVFNLANPTEMTRNRNFSPPDDFGGRCRPPWRAAAYHAPGVGLIAPARGQG